MILLTGASGYIGRHLLHHLTEQGLHVVPVYRDRPRVLPPGALVNVHLDDPASSFAALTARPAAQTVIHLAGEVSNALQPDPANVTRPPVPGPVRLHEVYTGNVLATANVVSYCLARGVRHLVFASTQAVYGIPPGPVITEDTPTNPLDYYAASKVACEDMLRLAARQGLRVTILRFPGIYGRDRRSGAVWRFCRDAVTTRRIEVTTPYQLPYDILHIDDLLTAFAAALERPAQGYRVLNIGSGESCNLNLLAHEVASLVTGCTVQESPVPQPVIEMDARRAQEELGWTSAPRRSSLWGQLEDMYPPCVV